MAGDVVVDLSGAEDEPPDLLAIDVVVENRLEAAFGELLQRPGGLAQAKSPFGVITISGRAFGSSACLRSRWKYWDDVLGFAIRMFSCAAS